MIESMINRAAMVVLAATLPFVTAGCSQQKGQQTHQSASIARQSCNEFPKDLELDPELPPERPVRVPPALQAFVQASDTTLTISTFGKALTCIDISGADVGDLEAFAEGRLLGVRLTGHEWDGYWIVDRLRPGSKIEVGERPAFSPDGKRFAAVQTSGAGWGGLEGMGAWEITKSGVKPLLFLSGSLMGSDDAKLESWRGNNCFVVSWRDIEDTVETDRVTYRVELTGGVAVRPDSGKCAD